MIYHEERLKECHPKLQNLFQEVGKELDILIICGHRGEADQNAAFNKGNSKLKYPYSKHNKNPSLAVDVSIYPWEVNDKVSFYYLAGFAIAKSRDLSTKIRWGGNFNMDNDFYNDRFIDLAHFELI